MNEKKKIQKQKPSRHWLLSVENAHGCSYLKRSFVFSWQIFIFFFQKLRMHHANCEKKVYENCDCMIFCVYCGGLWQFHWDEFIYAIEFANEMTDAWIGQIELTIHFQECHANNRTDKHKTN